MVLASGGGTNLQAILDRLHGRGDVEVVGVGSDKPGAYALERAVAAKIPTGVFPRDDFPDREARDLAMADWIDSTGAELVALAGYMQLVSPVFRFTASGAGSSTSTRRCCLPSPASTRSGRRSSTA